MIKTFEELGEILADIENRLLYLENSQHFYEPQHTQTIKPETEWSRRQWDFVRQLLARVLHCEVKVMELRSSKKKPKSKWD